MKPMPKPEDLRQVGRDLQWMATFETRIGECLVLERAAEYLNTTAAWEEKRADDARKEKTNDL